MFARLLASVCLSIIGPCVGWSEPVGPAPRAVVVSLSAERPLGSGITLAFSDELKRLMASASYSTEVRSGVQQVDGVLVVLKLEGNCSATGTANDTHDARLATTGVVDGRVLPFTTVHCGTLTRMLKSANTPAASELYGRSLGRIVAHELFHILANETGHNDHGVSKACFTLRDLLDDEFAFQEAAVRKLRPSPVALTQAILSPGARAKLN